MEDQIESIPHPRPTIPHISVQPTSHQEVLLSEDIRSWYDAFTTAQGAAKKNRQEIGEIRVALDEKLFELKTLLVRTGRAGGWSARLREIGIPRNTADRAAARHQRLLSPPAENCPNGAIPMKDHIKSLITTLLPKLKFLSTPEAAYRFMERLAWGIAGLNVEVTDRGLLILLPPPAPLAEV